jgi:hypothetical protein
MAIALILTAESGCSVSSARSCPVKVTVCAERLVDTIKSAIPLMIAFIMVILFSFYETGFDKIGRCSVAIDCKPNSGSNLFRNVIIRKVDSFKKHHNQNVDGCNFPKLQWT